MSGRGLPVDPGLLERFRGAGAQIAWREAAATGGPKGRASASKRSARAAAPPARIAHLHDEEARVEEHRVGGTLSILVDSGPVGALVLLLELERRGPPALLTTHAADDHPAFPGGAIEARWDDGASNPEFSLPLGDLILLARYALA